MKQSKMYDNILERYLKDWVTDGQLEKYVKLKAITAKEAEQIMQTKIEQEQETEAAI